jgi:hypothetical protein
MIMLLLSVVTVGSVSAKYSQIGDAVYTVKATDPESNAIIYNMTQSPNSGYFDINIGKINKV